MIPRFITNLRQGQTQKLVMYGTSLSYHLAPILRPALIEKFGGLVEIINSGCPAKASRTGLLELENRVLKHRPDAVTIEFAVNDAYSYEDYPDALDKGIDLAESLVNCERMIERVQAELPECEIILMTMNPAYDSPLNEALAGSRRPELNQYYDGYAQIAAGRHLTLIDNFAAWQELRRLDELKFRAYIPDGVHPTPKALREFLVPHLLRSWGMAD